MKPNNFLTTFFVFSFCHGAALAGGSVSRDDVQGLLRNSGFDSVFQSEIELAGDGDATRLGNHFGTLAGTRVGPYQFDARFFKGKKSWEMTAILHTEWSIFDGNKNLGTDPPAKNLKNLRIDEKIVSVEFILKDPKGNPTMPPPLPVATDETTFAKKVFQEVTNLPLQWKKVQAPFEDEYGAEFRRGSHNGVVRSIVVTYDMGDHGGSSTEVYFDAQGKPAFVLDSSSFWKFDGPEETIDRVKEHRFYFENSRLVKTLTKEYTYKSEPEKLRNRDAAKNETIQVREQAARRLFEAFLALRDVSGPKAVVAVENLSRAMRRMTEADISLDRERWADVQIPFRRYSQPKESRPEDAAFAMLVDLGIIVENQEDIPDEVYSDVLVSEADRATLVITLYGLKDDDIQAQRYLVELADNLGAWQLVGIGRQSKRWEDRGGKDWEKL